MRYIQIDVYFTLLCFTFVATGILRKICYILSGPDLYTSPKRRSTMTKLDRFLITSCWCLAVTILHRFWDIGRTTLSAENFHFRASPAANILLLTTLRISDSSSHFLGFFLETMHSGINVLTSEHSCKFSYTTGRAKPPNIFSALGPLSLKTVIPACILTIMGLVSQHDSIYNGSIKLQLKLVPNIVVSLSCRCMLLMRRFDNHTCVAVPNPHRWVAQPV